MPTRILRDWTDSYHVEPLSANAERLFVRLIMKADDYGRYHADPRLIRAGCFPLLSTLRDTDISQWLAECETNGVIAVYEVQGRKYLAIVDFRQRCREKVSKYPAPSGQPDDWQATRAAPLTVTCPSNDGQSTARAERAPPSPSSSPEGGVGETKPAPNCVNLRIEARPNGVAAVMRHASLIKMAENDAIQWFNDCEACQWHRGDGSKITHWKRELVIHRDRLEEKRAKNGDHHGQHGNRELFISELTAVLKIKEEKATKLKNGHFSEGPLGGTWDKDEHRQQYVQLRTEIKGLKEKIENRV